MHRGYDSAGVHYTEVEVLPDFSGVNTLSTGIVGGALRGPLVLTRVTSVKQLKKLFGEPTDQDWGILSAIKVLKNSNSVYYKRVVSSAARKGVAGVSGMTCKYLFQTRDYDESLNGCTINITKFPGSTTIKRTEEPLSVRTTTRTSTAPAEGEDPVLDPTNAIPLDSNEELKRVLRVYTVGEGARVYTPGTDYTVDFEAHTITWLAGAVQPPASGVDFKVDVVCDKVEAVVKPDSYKYVLTRRGNVVESLNNLQLSNFIDDFNVKSEYFTVEINPNFPTNPSGSTYKVDLEGVYTIAGGNAGIAGLTADDYIGAQDTDDGMKAFLSAETVDISTLIVPGVSDDRVIAEGIRIAELRGDIMYIPELPIGLTPVQADKFSRRQGDWTPTLANGLHEINSAFAALYYPWVQEYLAEFSRNAYTPASAWVASQWAYSDTIAKTWFAPAGFQNGYDARGILSGAIGLEHRCTVEERDLLYADDNGTVNPIASFPGRGIVLWGNKTALKTSPDATADSSFTQISVRRMCNYIRKVVTRVSMETLFEPNKQKYRDIWRAKVERFLEEIKNGDGIRRYKVVCDKTTVSDEDEYYGRMPGKIYVQPEHAIEWIPITFVITHDSVYFDESDESEEA